MLSPKSMQLVALSGPIGSGKSYLSESVLVRRLGYVPWSLALHMKQTAVVQWKVPPEEAFGSFKSERTRRILQVFGTEICREGIDPNYHTKICEAGLLFLHSHGVRKVCFTDLRFKNEADWIHSLGGIVIALKGRRDSQPGIAGHISESEFGQLNPDIEIDNSIGRELAACEELFNILITRD